MLRRIYAKLLIIFLFTSNIYANDDIFIFGYKNDRGIIFDNNKGKSILIDNIERRVYFDGVGGKSLPYYKISQMELNKLIFNGWGVDNGWLNQDELSEQFNLFYNKYEKESYKYERRNLL